MTELAKRAVASPHWRWMPGMLGLLKADPTSSTVAARLTRGWRVEQADLTASFGAGAGPASIHEVGVWLPDLTDPCTLGGLLALVREAWGDPHVYVLSCASEWWTVCSPSAEGGKWIADPPTFRRNEAEALVVALEAAP